ncbi:hypothetical protein J4E93_009823 [Alternaria ventricosa]|uniref:uncharacterized protein n=1 Tax=Alternaria ventricosa TaxID=1187951 RepID=UPI0020C21076|nr:uncharacterized protein J4E93_009823 [Alternaria ventricosa]KAI4638795.1 hypothetical protein J4E93_009823 [Alternaria ventricosa]
MSSFTLTPIVQQAVEHRLEELKRTKKSFERRYLSEAAESDQLSVIARLGRLLDEVKILEPKLDEEDGEWLTETIQRCIEQAQDDNAISEKKLLRLEKSLRDRLGRFRNRMEVSCLHAQLIKEATNAAKIETAATKLEAVALDDDDFEVVDNESEEVLEKFEKACSQPTNVNSQSIETYLSSLFTSEDEHLQSIRDAMKAYGEDLSSGEIEIDEDCLAWIMTDLTKSERLSPERKGTLAGYLQSPDALRELVATLNMISYRDWNYRNAEAGLPVDVRKTRSGQDYVHVEVDIIDMLFQHCCAIGWAVKLNVCLKDFVHDSGLFRCAPLTEAELDKRAFFFDTPRPAPAMGTACGGYLSPPPPPLPCMFQSIPPPPPDLPLYNSRKGSRKKKRNKDMYPRMPMAPPQPPSVAPMGVESLRKDNYEQHFFMSRLPQHDGEVPKIVSSEDVQARLIKTLAVECKLRNAFDGKMSIRSSASDPERLLTPGSGVAVDHGLEMLFSEAVLLFLDLATHKATKSYIYRLYDRCYFVGTAIQVKSVEQEAARFSDIMGLKLRNASSIGGLSIGLLTMGLQGSLCLDKSRELGVDETKVALYATHVEARLKICSTVLEWIREWNDTVGTYAAQLFGPLANVFDAAHRDAVKSAYRRIHSIVLGGSDLTTYVAKMLKPHLTCGLERMSFDLEPIIYLPQSYGGLGVKTPFVTLASAAKISESGSGRIEGYLSEEAAYYKQAADKYTRTSGCQRQQRLETIFNNDLSRMISALGPEVTSSLCLAALPFMTKAEMTEYRERTLYPLISGDFWSPVLLKMPNLLCLYHDLLGEDTGRIEESQRTKREVQRLSRTRDLKDWYRVSQLEKWTLQLYSEECFERYGGLEIWWAEGMPVEVYNSLRGHMSDDDDDDDDCSSIVSIV